MDKKSSKGSTGSNGSKPAKQEKERKTLLSRFFSKSSSSEAKATGSVQETSAAAKTRKPADEAAASTVQDPQLNSEPAVFEENQPPFRFPTPLGPDIHDHSRHGHPPEPPAYEYLGELPESYGTKRLYLVARDPQFLFAYWDFSHDQYHECERQADDGKVFLHIHLENGDRIQQLQLNPHTRNWHIHANRPGETFYAELGFYRGGRFEVAARSGKASAPRDNVSWKTHARFVTVPFHITFRELLDMIRAHMRPGEELAEALARLQEEGFAFPFDVGRHRAGGALGDGIYDYLGEEVYRRLRVGSFDITEVLRRRLMENTSSGQWPNLTSSMSSPFGASFGVKREFFMHVNAELIIYGGTDPNAKVRINGMPIRLREDGTFSYHFNLPDGQFHIPIEATAPDQQETRSALLSFLRMSEYAGEVTATPQPPREEPIGRIA